jgi:hypothetical protein
VETCKGTGLYLQAEPFGASLPLDGEVGACGTNGGGLFFHGFMEIRLTGHGDAMTIVLTRGAIRQITDAQTGMV